MQVSASLTHPNACQRLNKHSVKPQSCVLFLGRKNCIIITQTVHSTSVWLGLKLFHRIKNSFREKKRIKNNFHTQCDGPSGKYLNFIIFMIKFWDLNLTFIKILKIILFLTGSRAMHKIEFLKNIYLIFFPLASQIQQLNCP